MSITGYELVTVQSDWITADIIVWRRYRLPATGILEKMLDANPHLAKLHRYSPFIPVGTQIRVPIDPGVLVGRPEPRTTILLWGTHKFPK